MPGVLIRILLVAVAAVVAAYGIASAQSVDRCGMDWHSRLGHVGCKARRKMLLFGSEHLF